MISNLSNLIIENVNVEEKLFGNMFSVCNPCQTLMGLKSTNSLAWHQADSVLYVFIFVKLVKLNVIKLYVVVSSTSKPSLRITDIST